MRIFAFVSVLASLAVGAYLYAGSAKTESPASTQVQTVEQQAEAAASTADLQAAATELEAFRAANGTYEGASLTGGSGVTVVRADTSSYCIQTAGAGAMHETGPSGSPQSGPC